MSAADRQMPEELNETEWECIQREARRAYWKSVPQWARDQIQMEDLVGVAVIALLAGRTGKDRERPDYVGWVALRVRGAITDGLPKLLSNVAVPKDVWARYRQLQAAQGRLLERGMEPSDRALAGELGWPVDEVCKVRQADTRRESLAASSDEVEAPSPAQLQQGFTVDEEMDRDQLLRGLELCLEGLSAMDRITIMAFYIEGLSLEELADARGITPQAISNRNRRNFPKLRKCLESRGLSSTDLQTLLN